MIAHDAEYFRQRRRQQGIPPRDPLSTPRLLRHGAELRRLEQLPWPQNLFGEDATIAELMAEDTEQGAQTARAVVAANTSTEYHRPFAIRTAVASMSSTSRPMPARAGGTV